jgi:hypothetical protein
MYFLLGFLFYSGLILALGSTCNTLKEAQSFMGVIVLFLITAILGGLIYPAYRLSVRVVLEDYRMWAANGSFEVKEHLAAIGAGLLPAYWYFWRDPSEKQHAWTRAILTALIAVTVWWGFIVGHVLNNIRGFGT